jgi:formamidopyrimidine-DNA glycosylase
MPELPEVEKARSLCQEHCVGKTVVECRTREGGDGARAGQFDDKVLVPGSEDAWDAAALVGRTLAAARRIGKRTIWDFGPAPTASNTTRSIVLGFGMTGALTVKGVAAQEFKEFKVHDTSWPPKWTKLELIFDDGTRLAYSDSRRFGKIQLLGEGVDPRTVPPLSRLAPDPLNDVPDPAAFAARLRSKTAVVKSALLDQNFALCGLGNWLVDDVLFAARIHPSTRCDMLSDAACSAILQSAARICRKAVSVSADSERFPKGWLFHQRWGVKKRGGKNADGAPLRTVKGGHPIKVGDVAGRTTLWVPAVQKKGTRKTRGGGMPGKKTVTAKTGGRKRKAAAKSKKAPAATSKLKKKRRR